MLSIASMAVAIYALRRPVQYAVEKVTSRRVSSLEGREGSDLSFPRSGSDQDYEAVRPGSVVLSGIGAQGEILRFEASAAQLSANDGFVIGRHQKVCHGVINHNLISKRQVRLYRDSVGQLMIEDLHATNPARVDGRPLSPFTPTSLRHRQTLLMGDVELSVAAT